MFRVFLFALAAAAVHARTNEEARQQFRDLRLQRGDRILVASNDSDWSVGTFRGSNRHHTFMNVRFDDRLSSSGLMGDHYEFSRVSILESFIRRCPPEDRRYTPNTAPRQARGSGRPPARGQAHVDVPEPHAGGGYNPKAPHVGGKIYRAPNDTQIGNTSNDGFFVYERIDDATGKPYYYFYNPQTDEYRLNGGESSWDPYSAVPEPRARRAGGNKVSGQARAPRPARRAQLDEPIPEWARGGSARSKGPPEPRAQVSMPEAAVCVVCQVSPQTHALIPCGHKCICGPVCGGPLRRCPICRRVKQGIMQIF